MKKTLSQSGEPVERKLQKTKTGQIRNSCDWSFFEFFSQLVHQIMIMFFSLAEWSSCANFDRSHNTFPTIFNFDPIWALLGPKRALLGALGARKRPNTRSKCLVTMIPTQSDQLAAIGTKSGPPGPSETLWGPQQGLLGPKGPFWRALECRRGLLRGPRVWYGCVPPRYTV